MSTPTSGKPSGVTALAFRDGVRPWARRTRLAALGVAGSLLLSCGIADARSTSGAPPVVATEQGAVRGFREAGVEKYLGIPYAAAPVGGLRWRPPVAHERWTTTRDASRFGASCAQGAPLSVFSDPSESEDCLTLNIFTTGRPPAGHAGRPVLVWIHGGGFVAGGSRDYDATTLAQGGPSGPTVVVTINHRLGLLGFLAHPELDREGHPFANYGIMDQQAALAWVRRNIAAFGGDPKRVTLGGQSAGGAGVAALLTSPISRHMAQRAIFQSGLFLPIVPLPRAEAQGRAFAEAAGCTTGLEDAAACLRKLPVSRIVALQESSVGASYFPGLVGDGTILPASGDQLWERRSFPAIPVLSGSTRLEGAFDASVKETLSGPISADGYQALVRQMFGGRTSPRGGDMAREVLARYPVTAFRNGALAWSAVFTDAHVCPILPIHLKLARFLPLYTYEFADDSAPWYFPKYTAVGAAHTADIQYLFAGWHGGSLGRKQALSIAQRRLSRRLVDAWTTFMYTGNPNLGSAQTWPRYLVDRRQYFVEELAGDRAETETILRADHNCAFWIGD